MSRSIVSQAMQFATASIVSLLSSDFQYRRTHAGGRLMEGWGGEGDDNIKPSPPDLAHDISQLVKKFDWLEMLNGSRTIFSTFPVVAGAVKAKADTVVGDAWEPIFVGEDEEWGKQATDWVTNWMQICDIRGRPFNWMFDLHIASMQLDHSGDLALLLRTNDNNYPLVQPLEAHRIGNRGANGLLTDGEYAGRMLINGIIYDSDSRPVAYNILSTDGDPLKDVQQPANAIYHIYDPIWYSQGRGIPSLAFGMNDWNDSKSIKDNEKRAQDILSRVTLIETNATGRVDAASSRVQRRPDTNSQGGSAGTDSSPATGRPVGSLFTQRFERGEIRYIKAGAGHGLETIKVDRPSTGSLAHYELVLRGAFMGMDWPIEWGYSLAELGGAVARAMTGKIRMSVDKRQNVIWPHAKGVVGWAVAKAMKNNDLPFNRDWYKWDFSMPAEATCDDGNDMQSEREDVAAGFNSLTDVLRRRGLKFQKVMRQKLEDIKFIKKLINDPTPVTMADMRMLTPNGNTPTPLPGQPGYVEPPKPANPAIPAKPVRRKGSAA